MFYRSLKKPQGPPDQIFRHFEFFSKTNFWQFLPSCCSDLYQIFCGSSWDEDYQMLSKTFWYLIGVWWYWLMNFRRGVTQHINGFYSWTIQPNITKLVSNVLRGTRNISWKLYSNWPPGGTTHAKNGREIMQIRLEIRHWLSSHYKNLQDLLNNNDEHVLNCFEIGQWGRHKFQTSTMAFC